MAVRELPMVLAAVIGKLLLMLTAVRAMVVTVDLLMVEVLRHTAHVP